MRQPRRRRQPVPRPRERGTDCPFPRRDRPMEKASWALLRLPVGLDDQRPCACPRRVDVGWPAPGRRRRAGHHGLAEGGDPRRADGRARRVRRPPRCSTSSATCGPRASALVVHQPQPQRPSSPSATASSCSASAGGSPRSTPPGPTCDQVVAAHHRDGSDLRPAVIPSDEALRAHTDRPPRSAPEEEQ